MEVDETSSSEMLGLVSGLLDPDSCDDVIRNHKRSLPEIIHHAGELVVTEEGRGLRKQFVIVSAKLLSFNRFLNQHLEPWLAKLGSPWDRTVPEPAKRSRLETGDEVEMVGACYLLLLHCHRLRDSWSWAEMFPLLVTSPCQETRFLVIEILRLMFCLSSASVSALRCRYVSAGERDLSEWLVKYNLLVPGQAALLAVDCPQLAVSQEVTKVTALDHVSLVKVGSGGEGSGLVEVESTRRNLRHLAAGVSVGQPVLISGEVGVGKTSLVTELAARTGRQLLTLQVSDTTDARLLVGLYRCTELPGQFVWEPGMVTRAVTGGSWLLVEDVDMAGQDVISLLAGLAQGVPLTVPSLGGEVRPAPGFQLLFTQRDGLGAMREELASLVTSITVTSLSQEELKTIIATRYPALADLTEKILRMFSILQDPGAVDFPDTARLSRVLSQSRAVSVRDLVRWCSRADSVLNSFSNTTQAAECLYQDAMDVFCRFISDISVRHAVSREIAFTLNISKERAEYFTATHKPGASLKTSGLLVGRVLVPVSSSCAGLAPLQSVFSVTRHAAVLLEAVARAVTSNEPVLLVGETGVGKTTSVQFLAEKTGRRLKVVNMNQQSDSADLLGGFKPVSLTRSLHKLRELFTEVFCQTFSSGDNIKFLGHIDSCFNESRWSDALQLMSHTMKAAIKKVSSDKSMTQRWKEVRQKIKTAGELVKRTDLATVFAFIEGILTEAVKAGDWLLLDEVNMSPASVLESLSQLLDRDGSVTLHEAGEHQSVARHPDFRLFACMNPATDAGKTDLAPGIRNRFTEIYCDEMSSKEDITMLVTDYLASLSLPAKQISSIVTFYLQAKLTAETSLTNGLGQRPTFSLRTLCRALKIASKNPCGSVKRSLYEAFSLAFLTELDRSSYPAVRGLISKHVIGAKETDKLLRQPIIQSVSKSVQVGGFWIRTGWCEPRPQDHYILTDTVKQNLSDLSRIVSLCDHPVLVQGDTSVGKTSLVSYLAAVTGNRVVRVNNHEHTDIQEYIGSYTSDASGKLVFKHGVLAEAMETGSWIILDELNLAPTDVLEALNRVLDDNRELFIPETGETIKASPGFRLFGTQNPPGTYGGRKVLSRAFKNRFIELHFDQLPSSELEIILTGRCNLPASYSKKMVAAMKELQKFRKSSAAFAGKDGFITLRDLFRWAERYRKAEQTEGFYDWDKHLAEEGFMILASRVRNTEEVEVIKEILGKVFKRRIDPEELFTLTDKTSPITRDILKQLLSPETRAKFPGVAWTRDMRRLAVLVSHAWTHQEPVLMVGETGCGKTTVVDIISSIKNIPLYSLSCHNNTESGDFLGGLRPDREGRSSLLFQWVDGPLVQAMKTGGVFLADEISLADDSVLERMNSVLEPEREILLAEKIGQEMEAQPGLTTEIVAAGEGFRFVGTMNPGGDYGKKELSPALRNRFTEVWCPSTTTAEDLANIVSLNLTDETLTSSIVAFVSWLRDNSGAVVSIRDVLSWISFINTVTASGLSPVEALVEGAHLVWLDGLMVEGGSEKNSTLRILEAAKTRLLTLTNTAEIIAGQELTETETEIQVGPFSILKTVNEEDQRTAKYSFQSATISQNIRKILRGLQIRKPILLEGSPGIGKTSLVEALSVKLKRKITRINLSDQTDIADLFGADLPVEGGDVGHFEWRNGPFLNAMEQGQWILLDELNLASQSILEGLNAVFDYRNEVYIPELNRTFTLHPDTKIFACQNPISEGGDRKGLPKSFLNRFSKIFMSGLEKEDYVVICESLYPTMDRSLISRMVEFSSSLQEEVVVKRAWGQLGSPWEFNLRDLLRWCRAMESDGEHRQPGRWVRIIYGAKLRTDGDRRKVEELYREVFGPDHPLLPMTGHLLLTENHLHLGQFLLARQQPAVRGGELLLSGQGPVLEMMAGCLTQSWPVLLTGPTNAGKTALVDTMASLTGNTVNTISLNVNTDTMELLGGFEQSDTERSLAEVWRRVQDWVVELSQELLSGGRLEDGLLLMQKYLQLERHYRQARRKEQLKIINEVIISVRSTNSRVLECEQFLRELSQLDSVQKGTFEWISSVLVTAMEKGNWLVLNGANICSASVLDRLNSVFEEGGRLVLSERGVLGDDVVTVNKHPNFRAFLIYDPSKGEISRAMRNRCVELYVDPSTVSEFDIKTMKSFVLGTADLSGAARGTAQQIVKGTDGLRSLVNKLTLVSQDALLGGLVPHQFQTPSQLEARRVMTSMVGSTALLSSDCRLLNLLHHLKPVLEIAESQPELLYTALDTFLRLETGNSQHKLSGLLQWLLGAELEELVTECRSSCVGDKRLLPRSAQGTLTEADVSQGNKEAVVTSVITRVQSKLRQFSAREDSLLAVGSLCHDVPVIQQFSSLVSRVVSALKTDLLSSDCVLTDSDWETVDRSLDWLAHFCLLGGRAVRRAGLDSLARTVAVHWAWLYKHLTRWTGGHTQATHLNSVLAEYDETVRGGQLSVQTTTKLKRILGCAPLPPSSPASCLHRSSVTELSREPVLAVSVHRVNFSARYGARIQENFNLLRSGQKQPESVVSEYRDMLEQFKQLVEQQESLRVSPESYFSLQLAGLQEQLDQLRHQDSDQPLSAFQHRLVVNCQNSTEGEKFIEFTLDNKERPGVKAVHCTDYDPILMKVTARDDHELPADFLQVFSSLTASSGISVSTAEEKFDQLKQIKEALTTVGFTREEFVLSDIISESSNLLKALALYLNKSTTDLEITDGQSLNCPPLFPGFSDLLSELSSLVTRGAELDSCQTLRAELLLNCIKLQLFSLVGVLDPAEKQAIKREYAQHDLDTVKERLLVSHTFQDILGLVDPHNNLLCKRRKKLEEEVRRRSGLAAVRSREESFEGLRRDLSHFSATVGSCETVTQIWTKLEDNCEAQSSSWIISLSNFVRSLQSYSTFPDIVVPVAEAACRLMRVVQVMTDRVSQRSVRDKWLGLDQTLTRAASLSPSSPASLLQQSRWLLSGNLMNLFEAKDRILFLQSSLLSFAQSSFQERGRDVLHSITTSLLHMWREEEELQERIKAEKDAMYRTKTLCSDEDEEAEAEAEYKSLFPTFSDVFQDLSAGDTLNVQQTKTTTNQQSAESGDSLRALQIQETVLMLEKILLKQDRSHGTTSRKLFGQRLQVVLNLIKSCQGLSSPDLQRKMIPNLVSQVTLLISKFEDNDKKAGRNFYKDFNFEQISLVRPILETLTVRIIELLESFPENPVLLQILKVKSRVTSLSVMSPLQQFLTGLELLLKSCQEWEKNAHKGVSIQEQMDKITDLILTWRKLELSGLKVLLDSSLTELRDQTVSKFWLHVAGIVLERGNKKEEVVRSLVRFMEAGSVADFQARLDIIESVSNLLDIIGTRAPVLPVLRNLHIYYSDLNLGVEKALKDIQKSSDTKMKEFLKFARWKDNNFWSVQTIMEKTKKALHKTLREFQKSVSVPCNTFFKEITSDNIPSEEKELDKVSFVFARSSRTKKLSSTEIFSNSGKNLGSVERLDSRACKWSKKTVDLLGQVDISGQVSALLPQLVTEMDTLRGLAVDRRKTEEEQKKQAGFIQQRKRTRLNELFKTLQRLGFSYRFGLINCTDINNYEEMYKHLDSGDSLWRKSEKYFFRTFSRFRHLLTLLDRAPPPDIGCSLHERFQGFVQHMLSLARDWRGVTADLSRTLTALSLQVEQFQEGKLFDLGRDGAKYRALLFNGLDLTETLRLSLEDKSVEYSDLSDLRQAAELCGQVRQTLQSELTKTETVLAPRGSSDLLASLASKLSAVSSILSAALERKRTHPVAAHFQEECSKLREFLADLDRWCMQGPPGSRSEAVDVQDLVSKSVIRSLLSVQSLYKKMEEMTSSETTWLKSSNKLMSLMKEMSLIKQKQSLEKLVNILSRSVGAANSSSVFLKVQESSRVAENYLEVVKIVEKVSVLGLMNFNKLLSVIVKLFCEIAVNGFCPVKDLDDESSKTSNDFKSSEEETGLGQGEGSKDVSDQIDNEDMLDGAYQNQEDANENEEQDNKEEDNGIEMSDNFESNLQDKKQDDSNENDDDEEEDKSNELDDEKGDVDDHEDLDKDMWDEEDADEEDSKDDLDDSDSKGNAMEEKMDDLSAKEDNQKTEEKRQRKEETEEPPEFDDDQTDPYHGEDNKFEEPESFDLPENMDLDDGEKEDNFEEPDMNEPEVKPDFEDPEESDPPDDDENNIEKGMPEVESMEDDKETDKMEEAVESEKVDEDKQDESEKETESEENIHEAAEAGMDLDEKSDQQAIDVDNELDQEKKDQGNDGLNTNNSDSSSKESFGVVGKDEKDENKDDSGAGTASDCEKSIAKDTEKIEKLDIVDGQAMEEDQQGEASLFQHVENERETDRSAIDRADEKEVKEQVLPDNFEMEENEEKEKIQKMEEDETFKNESTKDSTKKASGKEESSKENEGKMETLGELVPTYGVSRGNESIISTPGALSLHRDQTLHTDLPISLEPIQLSDATDSDVPVMTQLSHQLCEQLRLILEPTKASKLQGDFKTGKRLNMRKIIPYIASQFKKDKIWLRRVKPNKREFQILVALDDSSSMADNETREIALSSLNTLSSALSLLEVGQLGVLRFGQSAEVIHSLGSQWSQSAGARIQNQFTFDQKETSLLSLLSLATQVFRRQASSASRNLTVSQLLIIVSDGRGVFHEGREKVMQAVLRARHAGYFCLFLIVENPTAKDSVLDIKLPVFSGGKLLSIDSYMEHFPFQHYIVLRDVNNLPRTLSDALRQWFELVLS